jgi:hypothetical protein
MVNTDDNRLSTDCTTVKAGDCYFDNYVNA